MSDQSPLVTVYIPTYNRADLLKRAVESVREQTYKNLEIIIVDDCSTDDTHAYLKEISDLDQRIHYFIKEKNSGACVSRNIAIKNALGEYITGLDDDDYFLSDRIEFFIKNSFLLEKHSFLFTGLKIEKNEKIKIKRDMIIKEVSLNHLIYANYVGNQIFCKTSTILNCGAFDENLSAWQDYDCWINILSRTNGTGKYILAYNYVVNDNDHIRITHLKKEKIKNVFNILSDKYNIGLKEKKIMSVGLLGYGIKIPFINIFTSSLKNVFYLWFWIRLIRSFKMYFSVVLKK